MSDAHTKTIAEFNAMLDWKLLRGSHKFPGPQGGTCINEAAIIAAGFEYKKVNSAFDCPPCFSRPIAAFAIGLNDRMPDKLRNELLMPFVTRLSGTADTRDVEAKRIRLIGFRTCRDLFAPLCIKVGMVDEARLLGDFDYLSHSRARTRALIQSILMHPKLKRAFVDAVAEAFAVAFAVADAEAFAVAFAVADAVAERRRVWQIAVDILDEAIKLGNQPSEIDHGLVLQRLAAAKAHAAPRAAEAV